MENQNNKDQDRSTDDINRESSKNFEESLNEVSESDHENVINEKPPSPDE